MINESRLTARRPAPEDAYLAPAAPSAHLATDPLPTTILLVEDDAQVRQMTQEMLAALGHRVLAADSEAQALWVWQRHQGDIQLLITDVMIPTCTTGMELARRFQRDKTSLRVLFTSGFSREIGEEDMTCFRSKFLQKPYTFEALRQIVSECLRAESGGA